MEELPFLYFARSYLIGDRFGKGHRSRGRPNKLLKNYRSVHRRHVGSFRRDLIREEQPAHLERGWAEITVSPPIRFVIAIARSCQRRKKCFSSQLWWSDLKGWRDNCRNGCFPNRRFNAKRGHCGPARFTTRRMSFIVSRSIAVRGSHEIPHFHVLFHVLTPSPTGSLLPLAPLLTGRCSVRPLAARAVKSTPTSPSTMA